jgi:hypothetical protein
MDTPAVPVNAHDVNEFYLSNTSNTAAHPVWMTGMNFLDPNYSRLDDIPSEPTNDSFNKL